MAGVIETERELLASFAAMAREDLGPEASQADIDAHARKAYYGSEPNEPPTGNAGRTRRTRAEDRGRDRADGQVERPGTLILFDTKELFQPLPRKLHAA